MKRFFYLFVAAVALLPLLSSCNKEDKNEPSTPTGKEVVKIVLTGEAEYDCTTGATKVDVASKVELKNKDGVIHTFAANEDDYKFSIEYPADATTDTLVLAYTVDFSKVDTTKSYTFELDLEDIKVTKYYKDGTSTENVLAGQKRNTTIKGSQMESVTVKATKVIDF